MVQLNPFKVENEFDHYFSDDRREVSSLKPSHSLKFYLTIFGLKLRKSKRDGVRANIVCGMYAVTTSRLCVSPCSVCVYY